MIEKTNSEQSESSASSQNGGGDQMLSETAFDISLQYDSVRGFIREASPLVSPDGMFVPTDSPAKIGSVVSFQMLVGDDFNLGKGTGVVAWRGHYQGVDGEVSGLAISFKDIDFSTRALVQRVVDQWSKTDGTPFRLERHDSGSEVVAPEIPAVTEPSLAIDQPADVPVRDQSDSTGTDLEIAKPSPSLEALLGSKDSKLRQLVEQSDRDAPHEPDTDEPAVGAEVAAPAGMDESPVRTPEPAVEAGRAAEIPDQDGIFDYDEAAIDEDFDSTDQSAGNRRQYLFIVAVVFLVLFAAGLFFKAEVLQFIDSIRSQQDHSPPERAPSLAHATVTDAGGEGSRSEAELDADFGAEALGTSPAKAPGASPKLGSAIDSGRAPQKSESSPVSERGDPVSEKEPGEVATENHAALTGVDKISWEISQGQTALSILGNGIWVNGSYKVYRLRDRSRPRQLLKIYGIGAPYSQTRMRVGSEQVHQVRIGHHPEFTPPELHIVADLSSNDVELEVISALGRRLEMRLVDK